MGSYIAKAQGWLYPNKHPKAQIQEFSQPIRAKASWYGEKGSSDWNQNTAYGYKFDGTGVAVPQGQKSKWKGGEWVLVTDLDTGKKVLTQIRDTGPLDVKTRQFDLAEQTAAAINPGYKRQGLMNISLQRVQADGQPYTKLAIPGHNPKTATLPTSTVDHEQYGSLPDNRFASMQPIGNETNTNGVIPQLADIPNINNQVHKDQATQVAKLNQEKISLGIEQIKADIIAKERNILDENAKLTLQARIATQQQALSIEAMLIDSDKFLANQKGYLTVQEQITQFISDAAMAEKQKFQSVYDQARTLVIQISDFNKGLKELQSDIDKDNKKGVEVPPGIRERLEATKKQVALSTNELATLTAQLAIMGLLGEKAREYAAAREIVNKTATRQDTLMGYRKNYDEAMASDASMDPFTAQSYKREAAVLGQKIDYRKQSQELEDFIRDQKLSNTEANQLREQLQKINDIKLTNIIKENDMVYQSLDKAIETALTEFQTFDKKASEIFKDLGKTILKAVTDPYIKMVSDRIASFVTGITGQHAQKPDNVMKAPSNEEKFTTTLTKTNEQLEALNRHLDKINNNQSPGTDIGG